MFVMSRRHFNASTWTAFNFGKSLISLICRHLSVCEIGATGPADRAKADAYM